MAKGYWIGMVDVDDPEAYKAYVAETANTYKKYGARFVVRGGTATTVEGKARSRIVVVEFADYETALVARNSPEYAKAKALRENISQADVVVVEGYDGPQPNDN
ncbi:DUF1330 domain-containing protein (plasmid) [Agrobacterium leguminum]|uniref:DUF1330 domain-containing protein n=1 Tax=Agrobacterium deltaense NCPPB 1641 TaxID=1183425 RepID=A0A1S7U8R8_9HYPH|nr:MULTISPECIES: DUF1330 domain-containing protein [Agrobacterium]WFS70035.1 DUF1330 domain-containing protein [Agrobacterium leguminum]CVI63316.1 conserved hypothetical protein; putative Dimeric alpha-beta barrel domain [Agrobacterium deltaense NCPPB 1641]